MGPTSCEAHEGQKRAGVGQKGAGVAVPAGWQGVDLGELTQEVLCGGGGRR